MFKYEQQVTCKQNVAKGKLFFYLAYFGYYNTKSICVSISTHSLIVHSVIPYHIEDFPNETKLDRAKKFMGRVKMGYGEKSRVKLSGRVTTVANSQFEK